MKRKQPLSSVAGIIDAEGYFRVVVTKRWRMRYHVHEGERLFVVPDFLVAEPVPWGNIPWVISKVEDYIAEWARTRNEPVPFAVGEYLRRKRAGR